MSLPLVNATLVFEDFFGESSSDTIIGIDTVMLYVMEDLSFSDTLEFGGIPLPDMDFLFDYIYLHHSTTNMFPIGLSLGLVMYNDSIGENIDTIDMNGPSGEPFIQVPDVFPNGLVDESTIETYSGQLELDELAMDNLMHNTTHLILDLSIPQTDTIVRIIDRYSLELSFGISTRFSVYADLDSLNLLDSLTSKLFGQDEN
jgi:hypothetical protein